MDKISGNEDVYDDMKGKWKERKEGEWKENEKEFKGNAKNDKDMKWGFAGVVYHTVNQRWTLVERGSSHFWKTCH